MFKKSVIAMVIVLAIVSCATVQPAQQPSTDKISARLSQLEPIAKEALDKVKTTESWAAFESKKKESDAAAKVVESTKEWKAYKQFADEQAYLKMLMK